MPLSQYGVVVGDIVAFGRDDPVNFGHWYHGHINVNAGGVTWTSALDVSSRTGVQIFYRTSSGVASSALGPVATMAPGYHALTHDSASGAVDYLRSGFLQDQLLFIKSVATLGLPKLPVPLPPPPGPPVPGPAPLANVLSGSGPGEMPGPPDGPSNPGPTDGPPIPVPKRKDPIPDSLTELLLRLVAAFQRIPVISILFRIRPWLLSDGKNALDVLEQHAPAGARAYLFGQRFEDGGNGVHDVHQNQGDPAGSQWWASNGTWQDGVVAIVQSDGRLFVWQVRFASQATKTDNDGHPA